MKIYGWDSVKLAEAYSLEDLSQLRLEVERQHRLPKSDDIYLYDKKGYWKLQRLAWAVRHRMSP